MGWGWWVWGAQALAGTTTFPIDDTPLEGELQRPAPVQVTAPPTVEPAGRRGWRLERRAIRLADRAPARAERLRSRAMAVYEAALERAPTAVPGVHLQLARLLAGAGQYDEAAAELREALDEAPTGPVGAQVRVELADLLFADNDVVRAAELYAGAFDDPVVGGYAAYKAAWCRYDLGDTGGALDLLVAGMPRLTGLAASEARKDGVRFVAFEEEEAQVRAGLARLCGEDPACVDAALVQVDELRAEVALPPIRARTDR